MIARILAVLSLLVSSISAELIPAERLPSGGWVPGTNVGVPGGIDQYRPGGASERVTIVDVTDAPYLAAGVSTQTTGSISSASSTLVVASATSFQEGQTITVGVQEVQTLTVTAGASATASVLIYIGANSGAYRTFRVPVVSGDTATQVATKIRAYDYESVVAATGSGTDVIFTYSNAGARVTSSIDGTATGVTGSFAETTAGLVAVHTTIASIAGTTFTLTAPSASDVTNGQVLHDDAPAIQAAVAAAIGGAGNVVYLPAGTYRIESTITLGTTFSGKTLRGAGDDATFIDQQCDIGIFVGSGSAINPAIPPVVVTSGLTKGSTSVGVDQIPAGYEGVYDANSLVVLQVENDPAVPVVSVYNYDVFTNEAPTRQMVRVTSQSGTTINFFPALLDDYGSGTLEARVSYVTFFAEGIGVEDLTLDANLWITGGGAYEGVGLHNCYNSWIRGVKSLNHNNYPLIVAGSLLSEVRRSWGSCLADAHSSKSALLLSAHSCLIEDNVFIDPTYVVQVNGGAAGNVFIYNFTPAGNGIWDSNHDPQNRFNLYEGNAISYLMSDGYFGGEAELTALRNYFAGPTVGTVHMRRFSRDFSIIGNIHVSALGDDGYPEIGNIGYSGTAQPSLGDFWADYQMTATLTTRTSDTAGELTPITGHFAAPTGFASQVFRMVWGAGHDNQRFGVVTAVDGGGVATFANYSGGTPLPAQGTVIEIGPGNNSMGEWYHELDLDVAASTIDKGNYYIDPATDTFAALGADTVPDSLAYGAKPTYFRSLAWPPFVATDILTADPERIPAGYRYANAGADPPGVGDPPVVTITTPASPPTVTTGTSINFVATATDTEDGNIAANIIWTSSISGTLGTGASITPTLAVGVHNITAAVTDTDDNTGSDSITATVTAIAPVINSATTANGTVGVAFNYQITSSAGTPTSYSASGLPSGLSVNTGTGLISGTPAGDGVSMVTLGASNSGGSDGETLTITIAAASSGGTTIGGAGTVTVGGSGTVTIGN